MKKILFIILAGGILLNVGCSDFDLKPSTSLSANETITTVEELQMAVNGVYQMMSVERAGHASDFGLYADCKGGDVMPVGNSGQIIPIIENRQTQSDGLMASFYFAVYEPIAFANMAMERTEILGIDSDPIIKQLYGELIAARAMLHFDAARLYSRIPTQSGVDMNKANSGVVIADKVYHHSAKFKRSTLQETYSFITSELERAIPMMTTGKVLGGMNAWAAKLILARAYLYMGQYEKAYTAAADVITNSGYKLFTPNNYAEAWRLEGADEFIFEVRTSDNTANSPQRNSVGYYTNPEGYAEVGANSTANFTGNMVSFLQAMDDNDIRKKSITQRSTGAGARRGYYTIKYMGRAGTTIYSSNPRPARLAEAYLIAAEAALKGGSSDANALKYYNDLRRSRYTEGTYTDATSLTIDDILTERRIEFFCENHRLFDLVRNNRTVAKYDGLTTYEPSDNSLVLPIPLRELDISPELKQNPGY